MQLVKIGLALACLLVGACGENARGDGGTVRLLRSEGGFQITVFSAARPLFERDQSTSACLSKTPSRVCQSLGSESSSKPPRVTGPASRCVILPRVTR